MSRLFLIPLLLALLWGLVVVHYGLAWPVAKKGFIWILSVGLGLAVFLSLMLWLTNP